MKCVKVKATTFGTVSENIVWVVRRVTDDVAFNLVTNRAPHAPEWFYATRAEWKAQGRKWGLNS